jgi:hypothetical protein
MPSGLPGRSVGVMYTGTYPAGQLRVSDAERDQAIADLSEHFQAGRLTAEELDGRIEQALKARTGAELSALFTDLPGGLPGGPRPQLAIPVAAAPGGLGALARMPSARLVLAVAVIAAIAVGIVKPAAIVVPILIALFVMRRLSHSGRPAPRPFLLDRLDRPLDHDRRRSWLYECPWRTYSSGSRSRSLTASPTCGWTGQIS